MVACSYEIASWTLEEKFQINPIPCIILYVLNEDKMAEFLSGKLSNCLATRLNGAAL